MFPASKKIFSIIVPLLIILSNTYAQNKEVSDLVIAKGKMPNMTRDKNNMIHIVFGSGDSILYTSSKDGRSFSPPSLVAILPKLMATAMRGPQIAASENGLVITACTSLGNIYGYQKTTSGKWTNTLQINDASESAKEALMALSADGQDVYSVWLDLRSPKGQAIYGSHSVDGGKSWSKNKLVYASPDGSVCDCCKPSVVIRGTHVYVMFRNLINGNRDMYLIESDDDGKTFGKADKLGNGSWKLNGCPMDGGGLVISQSGNPETVWRREGKIYAAGPGQPEKELGEGRGCSIESINDKNIYAWSDNGIVTVLKPDGIKIKLARGSLPLVKALNKEQIICVWENEKQIHCATLQL